MTGQKSALLKNSHTNGIIQCIGHYCVFFTIKKMLSIGHFYNGRYYYISNNQNDGILLHKQYSERN